MKEDVFKLHSEFSPAGDQPFAIQTLVKWILEGNRFQTLLGVTGSGKTFTLANVIAKLQRPVLVISHNKTLAAQLYSEFKHFFPENAVEYFISFYDYYQPEAYLPQTDTFIEKDASINEEIEKLRLSATSALLERRDVIIVASVSCIYGLGSPEDFDEMSLLVKVGEKISRQNLIHRLIELQYTRNDLAPKRGEFRVTGDTIDILLAYEDELIRIELWEDQIDRLSRRDPLTGRLIRTLNEIRIFGASHYVMPKDRITRALELIESELKERVTYFERHGRLVEAQRLYQRTMYDLECLRVMGHCKGIENYSRHLAGRPPGSRPYTLLDYFPRDFITVIDESHVTIPQLRSMYHGDYSRKSVLVEHGFRLPSALDNRPLKFEEFMSLIGQVIFVSATPGNYELELGPVVEQVVRPTGLLDPEMIVRPNRQAIDDLIHEIREVTANGDRVLVTTLTKKTAEDLSDYLNEIGLRVRYLHSEISALERVEILRDLRTGNFDVLVGINLLREGLDLPEVALVAILDADKEGFLRSERAIIQTAGRAARNLRGKVILYADTITPSMERAIEETNRRRKKQEEYNREHGITPRSVTRYVQESLHRMREAETFVAQLIQEDSTSSEVEGIIAELEVEMLKAAEKLEFERAAMIRDQIAMLRSKKPQEEILKKKKR